MSGTLVEALRRQAGFCRSMGAPFSATVLEAVAADVEAGGAWIEVFGRWAEADEPTLTREAVPLRALGGLHLLALKAAEADWTAAYPGADGGGDPAAAAALAGEMATRRGAELTSALRLPPQTNEVNRSAVLLGGFLTLAERTALPFRCLELGASAGLNQLWDRYGYRLGEDIVRGPADAPVRLEADWRGPPPPDPAWPAVVERRGCDQAPIDLPDPEQALRLQSFVWADQPRRLARLRAAIAEAAAQEVRVERADAVDWAEAHVRPTSGVAVVLYHSIVRQYLSEPQRRRLDEVIEAAGAAASETQPFAWLRLEGLPGEGYELRLTLWPGGEEQVLARAHAHGEWIAWKAGAGGAGA